MTTDQNKYWNTAAGASMLKKLLADPEVVNALPPESSLADQVACAEMVLKRRRLGMSPLPRYKPPMMKIGRNLPNETAAELQKNEVQLMQSD